MLLCLNKHHITKKSNLKKRRHCKLWQYILSWKIIKDGSLRNKRRLYFHSFYRRLFGDVEIYCVDEFTPLYLLISHTQLFMHGCILVYYFLVGSREKMLEFWGRYTAEKTGDKHLSSGIRNQYMTKIISQSFLIFTLGKYVVNIPEVIKCRISRNFQSGGNFRGHVGSAKYDWKGKCERWRVFSSALPSPLSPHYRNADVLETTGHESEWFVIFS